MKPVAFSLCLALSTASGCQLAAAPTHSATSDPAPGEAAAAVARLSQPMKLSDFKLQTLEGKPLDATRFDGQVLLLVNTASKCGFTSQYKGLQTLHERYEGKGLRVVGVPSNDFGAQEPGSAEQIGEFCQKNYGVGFTLLEKSVVKGEAKTPLFQWLTAQPNPENTSEVSWNFEKFLIGRDGKLLGRWKSRTAPDSPEIIAAIEKALSQ